MRVEESLHFRFRSRQRRTSETWVPHSSPVLGRVGGTSSASTVILSERGPRAFGAARALFAWGKRGICESKNLCISGFDPGNDARRTLGASLFPGFGKGGTDVPHTIKQSNSSQPRRASQTRNTGPDRDADRTIREDSSLSIDCHSERARAPRVWGPTPAFCVG
jgi:hypothetical protein